MEHNSVNSVCCPVESPPMVLTDAVAAWKFVDSRKLVLDADTRIVGTMDDIPLACLSAACTVEGGIWFWD